jgi:hypothetical protein
MNDAATTPPSSTPSSPPATTTVATATITTTLSVPPGPKLTIAQQIQALEEKMTKEERGVYLDGRDMGQDFCDARY